MTGASLRPCMSPSEVKRLRITATSAFSCRKRANLDVPGIIAAVGLDGGLGEVCEGALAHRDDRAVSLCRCRFTLTLCSIEAASAGAIAFAEHL